MYKNSSGNWVKLKGAVTLELKDGQGLEQNIIGKFLTGGIIINLHLEGGLDRSSAQEHLDAMVFMLTSGRETFTYAEVQKAVADKRVAKR
jgi:hypothetical protein